MPRITQLSPERNELTIELASKAKPAIISLEQLLAADLIAVAAQLNRSYQELLEFRCTLVRKLLVGVSISSGNIETCEQSLLFDVLSSTVSTASAVDNNGNANLFFVPSGCSQLDAMLGCSGFPRAQVTCLIGETSSGKSQICLQSSIVSALYSDVSNRQQQGLHVLYIDTHNQVFPRRLHSLLMAALLDEQLTCSSVLSQDEKKEKMMHALSRIHVQRCFDLFHCLDILTRLLDSSHDVVKFDLIILDGLHPLLAPLQGIQPIIAQLAHLIRRLCCYEGREGKKAAILITNTLIPAATSSSSLHRSVSSSGRVNSLTRSHSFAGQTYKTQQQLLPISGGWSVWSGIIDNLLLVEREGATSTADVITRGKGAGATVVKVTALQRPPFFQGLPAQGIISFPWQ